MPSPFIINEGFAFGIKLEVKKKKGEVIHLQYIYNNFTVKHKS